MTAITSPATIYGVPDQPTIFLAGSIENGAADDWQSELIEDVQTNILFLNPRREDWDPKAGTSVLTEQITWELNALEIADAIFMYLQPGTLSPISLLELGLYAKSRKLVVCTTPDFWRYENVRLTCTRYGVPLYGDFQEALTRVQHMARDRFDRRS